MLLDNRSVRAYLPRFKGAEKVQHEDDKRSDIPA